MFSRIRASLCILLIVFAAAAARADVADDLFQQYYSERLQVGFDRDVVHERNLEVFAILDEAFQSSRQTRRIQHVPMTLARQIYNSVSRNPVASLDRYSKYDPLDQGIGFCFGRAMTVHLEALFQGVAKESIMKLWALGDLRSGGTRWRYHVTTLLRGEDTWLAIDPITGWVMSAEEWYLWMKRTFDSNGLMRIYVTKAEKFHPGSSKYHKSDILDPFYNDYFVDLLDYYRQQTTAKKAQRRRFDLRKERRQERRERREERREAREARHS